MSGIAFGNFSLRLVLLAVGLSMLKQAAEPEGTNGMKGLLLATEKITF